MYPFNKTKEEIITDMCYTFRHDYGLDKHPDAAPFVSGMLPRERNVLYSQMEQILNNAIIPALSGGKE